MSILASQQWWIRVDGDELNGGGFDSTISGAGTNYSDQASPQLSLTDVVTVGTGAVTSVTGGFTSQMIGNVIRIAGDGYYVITSRTNTNTIGVDRNTGTGTGQSARIGGAWADFRNVSIGGTITAPLLASPLIAGNIVNVRAAGGSTDPALGSTPDVAQTGYNQLLGSTLEAPITVLGYNGRPYLTCNGLMFYQANGWIFRELKMVPTGTNFLTDNGFIQGNGGASVDSCIYDQNGFDGTFVAGIVSFTDNIIRNSGSTSAGTYYALYGGLYFTRLVGNIIDNYRGPVFDTSKGCAFISNVITRCRAASPAIHDHSGSGSDIALNSIITGNVIDSCADTALSVQTAAGTIVNNNNLTNNGGYGLLLSGGTTATNDRYGGHLMDFNNVYNNTAGGYSAISAGAHDLAVDPQYVSATGETGDYTPTNTLLKGAANPPTLGAATNYAWIGPIQPAGASAQYLYNRAKKELLIGTLDLDTSTLKMTLVLSTYVFDPDLQTLDDGSAGDVTSKEAAGVTRQTMAGRSVAEDDTNDLATLSATSPVFPAVTTAQTLGGMVLYRDVSADDTQSVPVAFFPFTLVTTGADVEVDFPSGIAIKQF
jgi:hypothetical protein